METVSGEAESGTGEGAHHVDCRLLVPVLLRLARHVAGERWEGEGERRTASRGELRRESL